MFKEEYLTRLVYFKWEFTCSLLGFRCQVRPCLLATFAMSLFLIYAHCSHQGISRGVLRNLVMHLLLLSTHALNNSRLVDQVVNKDVCGKIFQQLAQIGSSMHTTLSQKTDWLLFLLITTCPWFVISICVFVPIQSVTDAIIFQMVLTYGKVLCVVITKYLIAKRLRYIRSSDEYLQQIENSIYHTRQLLACNTELNNAFQLLGTSLPIFIFMVVQCMSYTAFAIHVSQLEDPIALENHLFPTAVVYVNLLMMTVLTSWSSTLVVNEVDEGKLEFDATLTSRPCTEHQRKLIRLFLMELHHTPIRLSAVGLFDIDQASVSSGICTIISYLLVLIQFT